MIVLHRWSDVVAAASSPETFGQYRISAPSTPFSSHAMAACDDDEHRAKRTAAHLLVNRAQLKRARLSSQAIAGELMKSGVTSVHDDLALPLAVRVLLDLLGLPDDMCGRFIAWFARGGGEAGRRDEGAAYLQGELLARMHRPRDDALSEWIAALAGNSPRLVVEYLVHEISFLFFAGTLPVAHAVASAVASPGRDIEETLRLDPPVPVLARVARYTTTISGVAIPASTIVQLDWHAANRDPARPRARHLSFGHGAHHCLGAALARSEIAAARNAFDMSADCSHI